MKKFALPLFLLALIVTPLAMRAFAKDEPTTPEAAVGMKTVAVLSITSYDELMKDLAFLGEVSGTPGLDAQLDGMIRLLTQGQGLKGLDTTKPWGGALMTDATAAGKDTAVQMQPIVFLPVKSLKELLEALGPMVGQQEDKGDGVMMLQIGGQEVFAREKAGWAFLAQSADAVANVPSDPAKLLGALSTNYDIAIRLNVQNVPEFYRTMAIDQIKTGIDQSTPQGADEDDETYAARKKLMEAQVEQRITTIKETQEVTLGWKIDREAKSTFFDLRMKGVAGTKTAAQYAQLQDLPSDFSGFIDEAAAASVNYVAKLASPDVAQAITQLGNLKTLAMGQIDNWREDDDMKKAAKAALSELFDALSATMKSGKMDAGASVMLDDNKPALVAGVAMADPKKVEAALKKFIDVAAKKDKTVVVKYDAATHKSIRFHTITVPVRPEDDPDKILGDKVQVAIGFGSKHVYVAVGAENMSKVTAAIDKSISSLHKTYPPARVTLSLGQILSFASAMKPDPMVAMLADELTKSEGQDHIIVAKRSSGKDGGVTFRLTAEEGVLKLIGKAAQMAQGGGGGLPGGPPPQN